MAGENLKEIAEGAGYKLVKEDEVHRHCDNEILRLQRKLQEAKNEFKQLQAERCEAQGHDFENCMTVLFQVYQQCKYCGVRRR